MPRPPFTKEDRLTIWERVLEAAMAYHQRTAPRGMQKVIADDADVKQATVSKWARGLSKPEDDTLRRLAELYGRSTEWLFGFADDETTTALGQITYTPGDVREIRLTAIQIVETVLKRLHPDADLASVLRYADRAMELLEQGRDRDSVYGILFQEVEFTLRDNGVS